MIRRSEVRVHPAPQGNALVREVFRVPRERLDPADATEIPDPAATWRPTLEQRILGPLACESNRAAR